MQAILTQQVRPFAARTSSGSKASTKRAVLVVRAEAQKTK